MNIYIYTYTYKRNFSNTWLSDTHIERNLNIYFTAKEQILLQSYVLQKLLKFLSFLTYF